jgi:hypothetical protein
MAPRPRRLAHGKLPLQFPRRVEPDSRGQIARSACRCGGIAPQFCQRGANGAGRRPRPQVDQGIARRVDGTCVRQCRLVAHRRPPVTSAQRSLRGGKQTSGQLVKTVENDPQRTINAAGSSNRKPDPSVNPAQTFFYLLSNRVGSPIHYGSRVRRDGTRGGLPR